MSVEICPLFERLTWLKHGFFDRETPVTNTVVGIEKFSDEFPNTLFLPQRHTDHVYSPDEIFPETGSDASVTLENNLALAVKTADCVPLLLACTQSRVIGAVHSGWQGASQNITGKTIREMEREGANASSIIAAIGPCIHAQSYPVGLDVMGKFAAMHPEALVHFTPFEDKFYLDVPGIIRQQLMASGVNKIWQSSINVFQNENYFSYRRRASDQASENHRNVSILMKIEE